MYYYYVSDQINKNYCKTLSPNCNTCNVEKGNWSQSYSASYNSQPPQQNRATTHSSKTQNHCDTNPQTLQCSCTISVGKHYAGLNFLSSFTTVKWERFLPQGRDTFAHFPTLDRSTAGLQGGPLQLGAKRTVQPNAPKHLCRPLMNQTCSSVRFSLSTGVSEKH